jgi:hypothetical protein
MTEQFSLSEYSTFTSLESIARNVEGSSLTKIESLTDRSFAVTKRDSCNYLSFEDEQLSFSDDCLQDFEIIPVEHAGRKFIAAAITFTNGDESLRYRVVTSHESEADWLRSTAARIGTILGHPPKDYTQTPRQAT